MIEPAPTLDNERYRLVRRLGSGGAATVYQAWDARLEVWRAIKLLEPRVLSSSSRARFEREARTMARVRHRNVLVVYDVVVQGERPYLVMDLVPGGSLADLLVREGALSPRLACRLVRGVLAGLQCAHENGVVHRDVKPHNILLAADGTPLVSDFGIARVDTDDLTRTGTVVGTLAYMAPEQRSNAKDTDARADVYAAACSLYTLIAGREPHDPYVDGPGTWDRIPEALVPVLRKATRWERDERWPTAAAFADALASVEPDLPETAGDALEVTLGGDTYDPPLTTGAISQNATFADDAFPATREHLRTPAGPPTPPLRDPWRSRALAVAVVGLVGLVVIGAWRASRPAGVGPAQTAASPRFTPVSTNDPSANPTRFYSLSPDGTELIYQTPRGLWHRRLDARVPDEPLALPADLADREDLLALYVPDGKVLLTDGKVGWWLDDAQTSPADLGEVLEAIDATFLSGDRFAVAGKDSVWVGSPRGRERVVRPRSPEEFVRVMEASPDESRLALVVSDEEMATLEVIRLDGSSTQVLVRDTRLVNEFGSSALAWLDDEHVAFVLDGVEGGPSVLMRANVATGAAVPIASIADGEIDQLYRVPGTDTLAYEVTNSSAKVWVGRLADDGRRLDAPRRLTLSDAGERNPAWMDEATIVYQGEHQGGHALFTHGLDDTAPRLWARQPDGFLGRPTRSPSGILATARGPAAAHPSIVGVVPPAGPHEVWIEDARDAEVRCAPSATTPSCLCSWTDEDRRTIARATEAGCPSTGTEVLVGDFRDGAHPSPDGRSALVVDEGVLWRVDVETGGQQRVATGPLSAQYAVWGADGVTAIVTGWTQTGAFAMGRIDVGGAGEPTVLLSSTGWVAYPALSPDGAGLAWQEDRMSSRIWRLDGVELDP